MHSFMSFGKVSSVKTYQLITHDFFKPFKTYSFSNVTYVYIPKRKKICRVSYFCFSLLTFTVIFIRSV